VDALKEGVETLPLRLDAALSATEPTGERCPGCGFVPADPVAHECSVTRSGDAPTEPTGERTCADCDAPTRTTLPDGKPLCVSCWIERHKPECNEELRGLVKQWRKSAAALKSEVEANVTQRQSAESKLSRVQVLESCADSVEQALRAEHGDATTEPTGEVRAVCGCWWCRGGPADSVPDNCRVERITALIDSRVRARDRQWSGGPHGPQTPEEAVVFRRESERVHAEVLANVKQRHARETELLRASKVIYIDRRGDTDDE
jgi:hypothetical protein